MAFGTDLKATSELLSAVRKATRLPLIAKLSPNVTDVTAFAKAAQDAGCDGLSLINTLLGMAIDVRCRRPRLANCTGGLSGPGDQARRRAHGLAGREGRAAARSSAWAAS